MAIITYESWYSLTKETFNWRGSELTAVDKALKAYHRNPDLPQLRDLRGALVGYVDYLKKKKGDNWEQYSRNSKGGIQKLIAEVDDLIDGKVSEETLMLRALLLEHRTQSLVRLFGGRKVVLKKSGKLTAVVTHGGNLAGAASSVHKIIKAIFEKEGVQAELPVIIELIGNHTVTEMTKAVLPLVGGISAGINAIAKGVDALQRHIQAKGVRNDHMPFVVEGTASKAAEGLIQLLTRRRNESLKRAALYTQQSALQIAGNFFPGGQIVGALSGAATAFGMLAIDCQLAALEAKEIIAANTILTRSPRDLAGSEELFGAYPLLGAYYIHYGNTNDILACLARDVGTLDWREVVQDVAKRHLVPMKTLAADFIRESRFEVEGLHLRADGLVGGFKEKLFDKAAGGAAQVLDRYMKGETAGDDFVRAAQPWISTPEAQKEVAQKAKRLLEFKQRGFTDDHLTRRPGYQLDRRYAADV